MKMNMIMSGRRASKKAFPRRSWKRGRGIRKKSILLILCLLLTLSNGNAAIKNRPKYRKGMITIKLNQSTNISSLQKIVGSTGILSLDQKFKQIPVTKTTKTFHHRPIPSGSNLPDLSRIFTIHFSETAEIDSVVKIFTKDPNIEYAEPVPADYLHAVPNDEKYSLTAEYFRLIKAEQAWDIHKGENGDSTIIIGIVDTGVDWDHPDLIDNLWQNSGEDADNDGHTIEWDGTAWYFDPGDENGLDDDQNGYTDDFIGWNFYENTQGDQNNNPDDYYGHGTHVAGIAAGMTNNGTGIASISWNVKFLPTSHTRYDSTGMDDGMYHTYDGIVYLAENGADIINCSFGSYSASKANEEAVEYASGLGSIIVASAGNDMSDIFNYPAAYPRVISVTNVWRDDMINWSTNYGIYVDISAPGTYIMSTIPEGLYSYKTGTSMASPMVAGLFGLIKSYHPDWTNEQLTTQLLGTSDNIDAQNPGFENKLGCGRINAYRALSETNVQAPQEYRLEWESRIDFSGNDGTTGMKPGQTGSFNFSVRNYAFYGDKDSVLLKLGTDDPSVEILNYEHIVSIQSDTYTEITGAFEIFIKENTSPHFGEFTMIVETDVPLIYGNEMQFKMMIGPSGILVWEPYEDEPNYSGTFIRNFLMRQNIDVTYTNTFPQSFSGFEAVFLSCGYGTERGNDLSGYSLPEKSEIIQKYLQDGGNLYIEGKTIVERLNLDEIFTGIQQAIRGEYGHFPDKLIGKEGSFTEGMQFPGTSQFMYTSTNQFIPGTNGKAAIQESDSVVVAVQNEGLYNQKTFCFSYALAELLDGLYPAGRYQLLARIMNFFGLDVPMFADFSAQILQDGPPLTVQFNDLSYSDPSNPITSIAWDFANNGIVYSDQSNPCWTYNQPGEYTVQLTAYNDTESKKYKKTNYVNVHPVGSALNFNSQNCAVYVPVDSSLDLTHRITIELWIKPDTSVFTNGKENYLILSKKRILWLKLKNDCSLELEFNLADKSYLLLQTDANLITHDLWQHLAISYDGENSRARIYINGIEKIVRQHSIPYVDLNNERDSGDMDLIIGNGFEGVIDDLRIWNDIRTQAEIEESIYINLNGSEEGLAAYWPMDEGCGDWIFDSTNNHNRGTRYKTSWTEGIGLKSSKVDEIPDASIPNSFALSPNYPNPFNIKTTINFQIPIVSEISLTIYDILGREVRNLVNKNYKAGYYHVVWDGLDNNGSEVSSGLYLICFKSNHFTQTRKGLIVK
jgi:subtilisin family serine protease/PKD repeat protein